MRLWKKVAIGVGASVAALTTATYLLRNYIRLSLQPRSTPETDTVRAMGLLEEWYASGPHPRTVYYIATLATSTSHADLTPLLHAAVQATHAAHPELTATLDRSSSPSPAWAWREGSLSEMADQVGDVMALHPVDQQVDQQAMEDILDPMAAAGADDLPLGIDNGPLWRVQWVLSRDPSAVDEADGQQKWIIGCIVWFHHVVVDGVSGFTVIDTLLSSLDAALASSLTISPSPRVLPPPLDAYIDARPRLGQILSELFHFSTPPQPYVSAIDPTSGSPTSSPTFPLTVRGVSLSPLRIKTPRNLVHDLLAAAREHSTTLQAVFAAAALEAFETIHGQATPVTVTMETPVALPRHMALPTAPSKPPNALLPYVGGVTTSHECTTPDASAFWDRARTYLADIMSHLPYEDSRLGLLSYISEPLPLWMQGYKQGIYENNNGRDATLEVTNPGIIRMKATSLSSLNLTSLTWGQCSGACTGALYAVRIASIVDPEDGTLTLIGSIGGLSPHTDLDHTRQFAHAFLHILLRQANHSTPHIPL